MAFLFTPLFSGHYFGHFPFSLSVGGPGELGAGAAGGWTTQQGGCLEIEAPYLQAVRTSDPYVNIAPASSHSGGLWRSIPRDWGFHLYSMPFCIFYISFIALCSRQSDQE
ncbi:hypothetical protein H1C71_018689 [Ictidomys tridecemlineatus]|nr:hypothetical protein H1C71_018689 [Ictidomys tridecemlineatus]